MEFNDVVNGRRSIRKFKPDALPSQFIDEMILAAQKAPSGLNLQPWRFVVVKDEATRRLVGEATPSRFVADAPVILICCSDTRVLKTAGARMVELEAAHAVNHTTAAIYGSDEFAASLPDWWSGVQLPMYSAIALTHVILKATDLGLGSCWVGHFDEAKVKAIAGLGPEYSVLALLPVGYPDQQPAMRPRLPVSELLLKEI